MNIAFFSECYRPTRNGVVVSIETFTGHLEALGHSVQIYAPNFRGYRDETDHVSRYPAARAPLWPDYPLAIPFELGAAAEFEHRRFDIVHTHSVFTLSHVGAFFAKRCNLPLVSTFHTMLLEYLHYALVPTVLTRPLVTWIIRRYCNQCDLMIVPTRQIGQFLRRVGVHTEIHTLPTGIDLQLVRNGEGQRVRTQLGIPVSHKVLLYVGRIAREKNMDFLMAATTEILQTHPDTHFLLVGGGPLTEECKNLAMKTGIGSRVHFIGSVPREVVCDYYAAADLFVFASRTETQGLVIGEAMAAGLPVVAVRAMGVADFIHTGEDGFLISESTPEFVQTVRRLLSNDLLRRDISSAARDKAACFSAENSARRLEEFYQTLIRRKAACREKVLSIPR